MAERYHGYGPGGRPLSYNPATTSMPTSIGYSSMYAGDMHVLPSSSRQHLTSPRGYYTSTAPNGIPTTTRTFAVNHEPRGRTSRESSRTRRSTLDSAPRPPVIVTTSHKDRSNAPSSSHSSNARSGSPRRESEAHYYGQSSPNSRAKHHKRNFSANVDSEDYGRLRDGSLSAREAEAYRSSRPTVVYPSDPRHSTASIDYAGGDYGTDGFQYTNAGELARYDLDHPKAPRRRRDSTDRGYYRPNINYNPDQRSLNVNTSPDLSRNYSSNTSRLYDGRGPPPSTRGFDRINRSYDDPRESAPAAPVPPSPTASSHFEVADGSGRRGRPLSLYQDGTPRSAHHDDYYRSREEDRNMRQYRDRDTDRPQVSPSFHDESVTSRGFGIRTDVPDNHDSRRERESRRDGSVKRSDESLKRDSDPDRRDRRHERTASVDGRRDRYDGRRGSDEEEKERSRLRDKVTGGLGIAAAAMGLTSSRKDDDNREKEKDPELEPKRRSSPRDEEKRPKDKYAEQTAPPVDTEKPRERTSRTTDGERERERERERPQTYAEAEAKQPDRRSTETPPAMSSESDEGREVRRRKRPSHGFDPNDASDLSKLKEQLAAMKVSDRTGDREAPEPERRREERTGSRSPPETALAVVDPSAGDERGRELSTSSESKQVRLVSPPRDKKDDKPIRGILKQPSAKFPEDKNPVREGVAPHKEDKKLKEVPANARWTKISRKKVNPEALDIGKERYEVRDDFVIVLRVLSKDEIQAYATATQILRERRKNRDRDGNEPPKDNDDEDEEDSRRHHHHRRRDSDEERDRERDGDRRRRHRRDDEEAYDDRHHHHGHHHQRSFRERERDRDRDRALEA